MTGKIVAGATAKIDNDSVVVSAAGVTDPAWWLCLESVAARVQSL